MKTILYAWEIGDGYGHLQNLTMAARTCVRYGNPVFAIPEGEPLAEAYIRARGFTEIETFKRPETALRPDGWAAQSFADVLATYAYGNADRMAPHVAEIQSLITRISPVLTVAECAPTFAMLAEPCVAIGTSWGLPDASPVMPLYLWSQSLQGATESERLLLVAQRVLPALKACHTFAECFQPADTLPLCYPGMDVWGSSRGVGPARACTVSTPGETVFAYLDAQYPAIETLLAVLPYNARVHVKGRTCELFDLDDEMARASIVIHHGSAGIAHAALSAGRPQVCFPWHVENAANAYKLHALGVAAMVGAGEPERFAEQIRDTPESVADHAQAVASAIGDSYPGLPAVEAAVGRHLR